jgi:pimeloyl-ACP methyl ester carboxylesterase
VADVATPVVFVHGLWLHATSWDPWCDRFRQAGYAPVAPGWPGEPATVDAARAEPARLAGPGVDDVVAHVASVIASLGAPPILVGHSFGGTIVQKLLGQGRGRAAVAIDAAPIKGVLTLPFTALRSAFPVLRNPANYRRAVALTAGEFRYAFANAVSEAESDELHQRFAIAAPGRPVFQAATANLTPRAETAVDTRNSRRGPLLLTLGGRDHTVPPAITRSTLKQYRLSSAFTDLMEFPDRGHSLVIDRGWAEVADAVLGWLADQGL